MDAIDKSIEHNAAHPARFPSYNVPLKRNGALYVGGFCRAKNGTTYSVVEFRGEWAVIVPTDNPQCGYTAKITDLEPVALPTENHT